MLGLLCQQQYPHPTDVRQKCGCTQQEWYSMKLTNLINQLLCTIVAEANSNMVKVIVNLMEKNLHDTNMIMEEISN